MAVVIFAVSPCSFSLTIDSSLISSELLLSGKTLEEREKEAISSPFNMGTPALCKASEQKLKAMLFTKLGPNSLKYYDKGFPYLPLCPRTLTPNIFSNMEIQHWLFHMAQQIELQHSETPCERWLQLPHVQDNKPCFGQLRSVVIFLHSHVSVYYLWDSQGTCSYSTATSATTPFGARTCNSTYSPLPKSNDSKLLSAAPWCEISLRSLYICSFLSVWDQNHSLDLSCFTEVPIICSW